ncbi:MAG: Hsp70 family protein [Candidatus Methanomethylophilaceae archaeon]|nr:Hsp70 family protein [Candidatus Methanomethylophilaceae archaeon]
MKYSVGIDLGTTYSCLAYIDEDGEPKVEKNFEQEETTPSVILFNENGDIIVGSPAKDVALMYPKERVITAVKRNMGTDFKYYIDGTAYNPIQLSATILKKLIGDFNENHVCNLEEAVITVPAYFGQNERDQTKTAGEIAGLKKVHIINEPTAAAIAFGYGQKGEMKKRVMVYDLGGGTFDVTILEIDNGEFVAVATDGERYLGGRNWDESMTDLIIDKVAEESGMDPSEIRSENEVMDALEYDSESIKKRLSNTESTKGTLTVKSHKYVFTVNREEFEARSAHCLNITIDLINRVLKSKSFTMDDIDEIILVGGSSRMPQIKNSILANFPGVSIKVFDPDQSIAKGAAIFAKSVEAMAAEEAGYIQEDDAAPVRRVTIKNVLSKTFGIKAIYEDGSEKISNLIFRNETLPIEKTKVYYPAEDDQSTIKIEIFENTANNNEEGCRTETDSGNPIGQFTMDLPEHVTRDTPIEVTFVATEEGILTANVSCMDQKKGYSVENDLKMTAEEIEKSQSIMERVVNGN